MNVLAQAIFPPHYEYNSAGNVYMVANQWDSVF